MLTQRLPTSCPPLNLRRYRRQNRAMRRQPNDHNGRFWNSEVHAQCCDGGTDDWYHEGTLGTLCGCCESGLWGFSIYEHLYRWSGCECRECGLRAVGKFLNLKKDREGWWVSRALLIGRKTRAHRAKTQLSKQKKGRGECAVFGQRSKESRRGWRLA
jgi:hypothetical protein